MQGPGDPGEEATPDARSASAHGRSGGVRGRQSGHQERTSQEGRGRVRRRLGEEQDADMRENLVVRVDPLPCMCERVSVCARACACVCVFVLA
jgi:hypothetical protein